MNEKQQASFNELELEQANFALYFIERNGEKHATFWQRIIHKLYKLVITLNAENAELRQMLAYHEEPPERG